MFSEVCPFSKNWWWYSRLNYFSKYMCASKLSVRIKGVNRKFCDVDWDETLPRSLQGPPSLTPWFLRAAKYAAKCVRESGDDYKKWFYYTDTDEIPALFQWWKFRIQWRYMQSLSFPLENIEVIVTTSVSTNRKIFAINYLRVSKDNDVDYFKK